MATETDKTNPVLILGGGINGCAVARELALNGVAVWVVEANDIGCGATSRSSRLIHGGLRYLEYGEFRLVRESLAERQRLLELAPQYVRPLRLFIPVSRRFSGLWFSILKFLASTRIPLLNRLSSFVQPRPRGLWLVRMGLGLYDRFARDPELPKSSVEPVANVKTPRVSQQNYGWLCAYTDAQMRYPERFTLAMLEDARCFAQIFKAELRVFTHATANPADNGSTWLVTDSDGQTHELTPAAVVNATGAWGDFTLDEAGIEHPQLLGGTRGSHFLTSNLALRQALGDTGVYAETDDGRLVFILPFGESVLVGTTDVRFTERPEKAVATEDELEYLIDLVNGVMPETPIHRRDISMHYSGVRPLPFRPEGRTAAISRDHSVHHHPQCSLPTYTLIGGKLTTCRAFAELVADHLFDSTKYVRSKSSRELIFAGGSDYPATPEDLAARQSELAATFQVPVEMVRAIWDLLGSRTEELLRFADGKNLEELNGTHLPVAFAIWAIDNEWAGTLDDLVDRRLMLIHHHPLTQTCLRQLAECLVDRRLLREDAVDSAVDVTAGRLKQFHGKTVP